MHLNITIYIYTSTKFTLYHWISSVVTGKKNVHKCTTCTCMMHMYILYDAHAHCLDYHIHMYRIEKVEVLGSSQTVHVHVNAINFMYHVYTRTIFVEKTHPPKSILINHEFIMYSVLTTDRKRRYNIMLFIIDKFLFNSFGQLHCVDLHMTDRYTHVVYDIHVHGCGQIMYIVQVTADCRRKRECKTETRSWKGILLKEIFAVKTIESGGPIRTLPHPTAQNPVSCTCKVK